MFKRQLVPLDGSHLAENALSAALELAAKFDGEIMLLRVISPSVSMSSIEVKLMTICMLP